MHRVKLWAARPYRRGDKKEGGKFDLSAVAEAGCEAFWNHGCWASRTPLGHARGYGRFGWEGYMGA